MHDVFERADHDENENGIKVCATDFDRYAKDIPASKIYRDIEDSQQSLGRFAATFMEDEIQERIKTAINNSIVNTVRSFTTGVKPFVVNVTAGVMAGAIFAAITIAGYFLVKVDPSLNAIAKTALENSSLAKPVPSK